MNIILSKATTTGLQLEIPLISTAKATFAQLTLEYMKSSYQNRCLRIKHSIYALRYVVVTSAGYILVAII